VEIYNGTQMVRKHKGPAFRSTCKEAISDTAWQAMTSFNHTRQDKLKDSVYSLFPRRKNTFKFSRVKIDVPKTMIIHSQNLNIQLSSRLNIALNEIHFLRTQLRDSEKTMSSYERIIHDQYSDLFSSDIETWTTTSPDKDFDEEPPENSHPPFGSHTR
jgi:hypothetical protein